MTTPIVLPQSRLQQAQDSIAVHISHLPLFLVHDLAVSSEEEGDLLGKINAAIKQGLGMFVQVMIYEGNDAKKNVPGPQINDARILVGVWVNPTLNKERPKIKPLIEYLMTSLHLLTPVGASSPIEMASPCFKRRPWVGAIYYELYFTCRFNLINQTQGVSI